MAENITLKLDGENTSPSMAGITTAPKEELKFEENSFTEEETRQIEEFAKKIDIRNTKQIMQYGESAQKKSTNFSDAALKSVKTKEFGEVGDLLTQLTVEVRRVGEPEKKGIAGSSGGRADEGQPPLHETVPGNDG